MERPDHGDFRKRNLDGNVQVVLPLSWHAVGIFLLAVVLLAIGFLTFASYTRVETIQGVVIPDRGLLAIIPSKPGVAEQIMVSDGDHVNAGQALLTVRTTDVLASGEMLEPVLMKSLIDQKSLLERQAAALRTATQAKREQQTATIGGISKEISGLERQIGLQRDLVEESRLDLLRTQEVANRGFVSQRDLGTRRDTWLLRKQQLAEFEANLATKRSELSEAEHGLTAAAADSQSQLSAIDSSKADLDQKLADTEAQSRFVVAAPIAGDVSAVTVRAGEVVGSSSAVMSIIPSGSRMLIELSVPSTAIGFLEPKQHVRISFDAFPFEKFGTVPGEVVDVSGTPVARANASGVPVPTYLAKVEFAPTSVSAFGRSRPIKVGMVASVRVITGRQSLLEWLFEPIFAVARR